MQTENEENQHRMETYLAKVLAEFEDAHPELSLVDEPTSNFDRQGYEWDVKLHAKFMVKFEGLEEEIFKRVLEVVWEECGDSQWEFEEFNETPRYSTNVDKDETPHSCICMKGKWYMLGPNRKTMDVARKCGDAEFVYKTLTADLERVNLQSAHQTRLMERKDSFIKMQRTDLANASAQITKMTHGIVGIWCVACIWCVVCAAIGVYYFK